MARFCPLALAGFAALILTGPTLFAQEQSTWPPVQPEDVALRENPAQPGSSAMILLKKEIRDDEKSFWERFYRIKVLTEKGRGHADIEIPYLHKVFDVDEIAARVIQPDSRITPFSGPIYEKSIARQRRRGLMAKTFSLPDVHPGTIIEYRYRWKFKKSVGRASRWVVQEELFTREAQLELRPLKGSAAPRILPRALHAGNDLQMDNKGVLHATLRNLPAFEEEPFMPPEDSLKMRFHVLYPRPLFFSSVTLEQAMQQQVNEFIKKPKALAGVVQQLVSSQDSSETKLRKIYTAVQGRIRNLSYEEEYTRKELKQEGMKERKSAEDVWKLGYGTSWEITSLFAALCRAAGFDADVVYVAKRENALYDAGIPLEDQLNGQIVVVNQPAGPQYFDPGTRFAPAGWVSWENQGVHGVRLGEKMTQGIQTPLQEPEKNRRHRQIQLELKPEGTASVQLVTTYWGQEAVAQRNEFFETSKEEREHKLRQELRAFLPMASVKEVAWEGFDDSSDTARVTWRFELPGFAHLLGPRLLVRPYVFESFSRFPNWKRKHPVYLRSPYTFSSEVRVVPPPGYHLESAAPAQQGNIGIGEYETSVSQDGNLVLCRWRMVTQGAMIPPEAYPKLKRFFDIVAANGQDHLVFRQP
jgi:hypothetical protein